MGAANKRGSREQRIAQAQQAQMDEPPINVPCKTCKEILNGFELLRTSPSGAAWQKTCSCGAITTALVQAKHGTLPRTFAGSLALTKEIAGKDKKVSVSFIEKNIDTVETGIIRF